MVNVFHWQLCKPAMLVAVNLFSRMRRRVAVCPGLIALLCAASGVHANELQLRPGMTGVADLGAISCQTYSDMYPNGPTGMRQAALYYVEGYIHARTGKTINAVLADQPDATVWDFDSLTDVMVDYCAANPEARVSDAAAELAAQLGS